MMTDREVWMKAGAIIAEHGAGTTDYIIDQMSSMLHDQVAVEEWRRVANAIDEITEAPTRGVN